MKRINFRKLLVTAGLCLFTGTFLFAQEKDNKKVHIKVKKDDATTVDTSFTIDENMDEDEVQKMIFELTGMDIKFRHKDDLIMEGSGAKNIDFYVYSGDKGKLDSLKKDHKDEFIIGYFDEEDTVGMKKKHWVMKKKMSGAKMANTYAFTIKDSTDFDTDVDVDVKEMEIQVTVDDEGESHAVIHKYGDSDHKKWVDHKSGNQYVIVKEKDGKKTESEIFIISGEYEGDEKKVIKTVKHKDGDMIMINEEDVHKDDKGNSYIRKKEIDGKKIIVLESDEKPVHFTTKDGKELELIVKDKKTGTDIALDKLKVITIETTEDGVINIVVSDKKEKKEKEVKEVKEKKVDKKK